jgi:hypothetical protein
MSSRVPESHGHVIARRRQAPVWAIGKTAHRPSVAAQIPDHISSDRVPDSDNFVLAGRGQAPAIKTEGHGVNRTIVIA